MLIDMVANRLADSLGQSDRDSVSDMPPKIAEQCGGFGRDELVLGRKVLQKGCLSQRNRPILLWMTKTTPTKRETSGRQCWGR